MEKYSFLPAQSIDLKDDREGGDGLKKHNTSFEYPINLSYEPKNPNTNQTSIA